ncbi:MAG: YjgN family protein [Rhodocyclaceae bacterium]
MTDADHALPLLPGGGSTVRALRPTPLSHAAPDRLYFEFTGRGGEYFGIWIVNLLLTLLTVGIYSAWAKVRRTQYFYRNTNLAGASFDYHGDPWAILKGRLIVFALLVVYNLAGTFEPLLALAIFVVIAAVMPILLLRSLRFRAANTSWSGLRFRFDGDQRGAYRVFLLWPLLTGLTLYLLGPMWHQRLKAYQHNSARFGTAPFAFDASVGAFYGVYLLAFGTVVVAVLIAGALVVGAGHRDPTVMAFLPLIFIGLFVGIQPFLMAKLQNLVWNHTGIGPHRFESNVKTGKLAWIVFTNLFGIIFTLGLFRPFAEIRLARYRIESMTLLADGPIDDFVAAQQSAVSATGEGAADLFDIDIAL